MATSKSTDGSNDRPVFVERYAKKVAPRLQEATCDRSKEVMPVPEMLALE